VYDTRDYLAKRVRGARVTLAESALAAGDVEAAGRHAEEAVRLSDLTPFEPDELRRVHRALAAAGSPMASWIESEAAELGVSLPQATPGPAEPTARAAPRELPRPRAASASRARRSRRRGASRATPS